MRVFTRSLDDMTERVPEVVEATLALDGDPLVLDGEVIALDPDGRPRPFQETASRTGSTLSLAERRARTPLTVFFFDLLHVDGDRPPRRPRVASGSTRSTAAVPSTSRCRGP